MHHPELEKKLKELDQLKKKAANELGDLASEAIENADRASKTMMMYLEPAGSHSDCVCTGQFCHCKPRPAPSNSRLFKKFKKALKKKSEAKKNGD